MIKNRTIGWILWQLGFAYKLVDDMDPNFKVIKSHYRMK